MAFSAGAEPLDPELRGEIGHFLAEQPEIDRVVSLLTTRLGMDSMLVAARIDLAPGRDSEVVELVMERIKPGAAELWPQADLFLDVTEAPPRPGAEVDPDLTAS
ncbi:hypothetical protein ACFVXC_00160 [Streptomyces sp. NPDC058257]|uniref:hypothetical protein n=1 Tax=Streptomyces sp. NPDC058257 TaxID=3346409 RepID=UPI0036E2171B